jgi:hypothetical protein
MSGCLDDFLVRLATDPDFLSRFTADASAVLEGAGLTAEERAAVLARDPDALRRALGASAADHLTQTLHAKKRKRGKKPPAKKRPGAKKRPSKKAGRRAKKR